MNKIDLQVLAGRNLQRCRTNANLTQEQVAERVGISTSFYTNLERGSRSMSIPVLVALADVLHVSTDCILYKESSEILVPRVHHTPDQLAIVLECRDAGVRFYAKYKIPSSDYKEHKKGATVRIEDDWTPIGFQVL